MMRLEVVTPGDFMGEVMGDINSRRGKIEGTEQRGSTQVVRGYCAPELKCLDTPLPSGP
ncbi:MAG: hypothetical protein ACOX4Y_06135 [Limnochordia bacterium]